MRCTIDPRCDANRWAPRQPRWLIPIVLLVGGAPAAAEVLTWPGPSPCQTTLHACIAAAAAGDVVEIATDGPITESIEILGKSLTLRPAAGFLPVFDTSPSLDSIEAFGADADVTIVVEGMTVRDGMILAYQGGTGAFDVTFRDNIVEAEGLDANRTALGLGTFGATPSGPVTFAFVDNDIRLGFLSGDDIRAIGIDDLPGATSGMIARNSVSVGGEFSTRPAIAVNNGEGTLVLDILANRIVATGYNGGIAVFQQDGAGHLSALVANNLVVGTVGLTGPLPGGISVFANAGSADVLVLNNTLAGNDTGFAARASGSGTLDGNLANNLVAGNASHGIVIDPATAPGVANEHNLVFGNGPDNFVPGPGTISADPQFAAPEDFHVRASSPARDAGNAALLPVDLFVDLDGGPRVTGATVDIGAYEQPEVIFNDGFEVP
jgi:hypothetical protein